MCASNNYELVFWQILIFVFIFFFSVVFVESTHSPSSCPFSPTKCSNFFPPNFDKLIGVVKVVLIYKACRYKKWLCILDLFHCLNIFEYLLSCVLYWSLRNVLCGWRWDPFEEEMCYNGHTLIRIVRQTSYSHFYLDILYIYSRILYTIYQNKLWFLDDK